ncbi:YegS/Rv2252/BmrU family lipid kinase [Synechococcus sp. CS-1325]|uniref:YegS/Rv2252/BmrU family lipid kinase n=1 Tax=unclassified Synechococcus TaxID=2626047 RepID=UPI000DB3AD82|nr:MULTISPECIES: YegS/Rv2252/BmrU family lipid kinase [unclassified Synechococcus]PZV00981.1 MAG: lipid kinase [Cyanobium sp.]MCT0199534.1 YegS/Rv2252/BmrU family lipid kinase [Synechococcus sp. CS-1325]MCT0213158.1 YegS/Rv2252/BmrU family lipid kinase [Synechococcus sp. CS-1326]MCT0231212.1 YegS/Rv2252/BmrU family lipid kinase [Synechococcus sp. CS-1324]MCT0233046.1 YegS/Rv2252/BmrU family lipid kinase [Synechococcus sp. CS-1327]
MSQTLALLAHPSELEALLTWVGQYKPALAAFQVITTPELARSFRLDGRTASLELAELKPLEAGGDIELAARVMAAELSAIIYFVSAEAFLHATADLLLLIRACAIENTPLALNEATADLAMRGLAHSRIAYLIFNPVAGQGNSQQELAMIRSILEPQILLNVVITKPDLDPADQARAIVATIQAQPESDPGTTMILASGGDGTVSAVAGAVIGTGIPIGIIPRGTANAFSQALGIPIDLRGACNTILAGHSRVIDAARCNSMPMILLAGLGFEAGMVNRATRELKNLLGLLAYVLAGAQQLANQAAFEATLDIDGRRIDLQAVAITVANVAPPTSVLAQGFGQVIPDDGQLEVTIGTPANRLQGLNALASLAASAIVQSPTDRDDLLCFRASTIRILTNPPQLLVIDGEIVEANPITFECLPASLTVFTPLVGI